MICENNIIEEKGYNQLIIPKRVSTAMTTSIIGDVHTNLFYTNYKHTNHTMETCHNKKEKIIINVTGVITHNNKNVRPMQFPCHMCGLVGHKWWSAHNVLISNFKKFKVFFKFSKFQKSFTTCKWGVMCMTYQKKF
jgi:hypothetical protein